MQNWCPSPSGGSYSRAPESFIFSLTNNQKFELNDKFHKNAIYRDNSYGPTFGGGFDNINKNRINIFIKKLNFVDINDNHFLNSLT